MRKRSQAGLLNLRPHGMFGAGSGWEAAGWWALIDTGEGGAGVG